MNSPKTFSQVLAVIIGTIIGSAIPSFIGGLCLMVAWNAVAWECNLPQFNYWTCFCGFYVVNSLFSIFRAPKKDS